MINHLKRSISEIVHVIWCLSSSLCELLGYGMEKSSKSIKLVINLQKLMWYDGPLKNSLCGIMDQKVVSQWKPAVKWWTKNIMWSIVPKISYEIMDPKGPWNHICATKSDVVWWTHVNQVWFSWPEFWWIFPIWNLMWFDGRWSQKPDVFWWTWYLM